MKYEQLSFIKPIEKIIKEPIKEPIVYDATICNKCCCDKCIYSSGLYPPLTKQEKEDMEVDDFCFNCDECFYYGMDDKNLSKDIVRFKCDKFKKANYYVEREKYYIELEAERRRRNLRII